MSCKHSAKSIHPPSTPLPDCNISAFDSGAKRDLQVITATVPQRSRSYFTQYSLRSHGDIDLGNNVYRRRGIFELKRWPCEFRSLKWKDMMTETAEQCRLAGPMITVGYFQVAFQFVALVFVGHFGKLALAGSSIATSVANVTGLCIMTGIASGLETLCGQAYGAKQYNLVGHYLQAGILCLNVLALLISFIYGYMDEILIALGQERAISMEAGKYARWLIPSLFAQASLQPLVRFLLTQSLVRPIMICAGISASLQVPLCWFLVYKTNFGFTGGALSTSVGCWIYAILLFLYVKLSSLCSKTNVPISIEALRVMGGFMKFALPSAAMTCTRVSNELGACNPHRASNAAVVSVILTECQGFAISIIVLAFRHSLGHLFSGDAEVIEQVARMLQLLAISSLLDSTQGVFSGIARGCGWQFSGAIINLSSYYAVALPVGACLAFLTPLRVQGLWIGVICGSVLQVTLLARLTLTANWDQEVEIAKRRMMGDGKVDPCEETESLMLL
ncbi:hypothetical protein KP509_02G079900 [Ceratopteris richardii]|uniref:Protein DETOXIFICATION n=1 Tax=Ceratopteris richardii TaxID=49495 RepID=A0A8T2VEU0_CERRI|nr:hypothetical protein KP509_02G079900 [Ceratopteris richardii]